VRVGDDGKAHAVEGLPSRRLLHVSADAAVRGALWVGTQGGAVRVLDDGTVLAIGGLPDPRVHAVARVRREVWFATEGGTAIYR
jgi:ligand-binding sensor domain-containing protein